MPNAKFAVPIGIQRIDLGSVVSKDFRWTCLSDWSERHEDFFASHFSKQSSFSNFPKKILSKNKKGSISNEFWMLSETAVPENILAMVEIQLVGGSFSRVYVNLVGDSREFARWGEAIELLMTAVTIWCDVDTFTLAAQVNGGAHNSDAWFAGASQIKTIHVLQDSELAAKAVLEVDAFSWMQSDASKVCREELRNFQIRKDIRKNREGLNTVPRKRPRSILERLLKPWG